MRHMLRIMCILCIPMTALGTQDGDIGFGEVKGIKSYNFASTKVTRIHLKNPENIGNPACNGVGELPSASVDPDAYKGMLSIALAAHASGKKVRLYSSQNNCVVDMIAFEDEYF